MKKKAIEKIPYIGIQKVSRKKAALYIGVTAVKIVGHEKHLFVEMYKNEKGRLDVPIVRIVLTKKDFGNFFPESGTWSRERVTGGYYNPDHPIWDRVVRNRAIDQETESILSTKEDLERIKKFTNLKEKPWKSYWWDYIDKKQDDIATTERRQRKKKSYESRQRRLKERIANTPKLPEKRILDYADNVIFRNKHYLYYKKHGTRARVACTKCGGVADRRWKPGYSYESQFEPIIKEPRKGYIGICSLCGAQGEYMPQGNVKNLHRAKAHVFLGQKFKETGMVFRYIEVGKEWQMELSCEGKDLVMENACEQVDGIEIARVYFEDGKKIQKDFHKHSYYDGDFWDDCNLYGMNNITIKAAPIMPETFDNMKGTFIQYSALREYDMATHKDCKYEDINPVDYIERYIHTPQIEMLVKLGLIDVVKKIVKYCYGIVADMDANRVDQFLGIRKEHVKQLIRNKGNESILKVLQAEKKMGKNWTDEQVEQLAEIGAGFQYGLKEAMEHMSIQKVLNLIAKYAGAEYGTGCSGDIERLKSVAQIYFDYLDMRKQLGYDLNNAIYLAPRNLAEAHQNMVMESNEKEKDIRIRKVMKEFPLIKKHYRRLRKKFFYEDDDFQIRPARDAAEIVMEGRILHHCVGGDNYLRKHNDGVTTILFLRSTKSLDMPYITVEIGTNSLNLIQWYGAHDKKPDKENMNRWIKKYITKLKSGMIGTADPADTETEQPMLMHA